VTVRERLIVSLDAAGLSGGGRWGVAVSGGADSTALMHLLADEGLDLHVLHVDHRLRPGSRADAEHVVEGARALGLPVTVLAGRTPERGSGEEAARDLRYMLLDAAAHALGLRWVLTAHTLDDQAETVLLRLVRGTGARGLRGIPHVRGRFVRPLLEVSRGELRGWLSERAIAWREDPTNSDLSMDRNWVRAAVLPSLAERFPGAVSSISRHASLAASDEAFLQALADEVIEGVELRPPATLVEPAALLGPRPIAARVARSILERSGGRADAATVARVLDLARAAPGATVVAGPGCEVRRTDRHVAFVDTSLTPPDPVVLPDRGTVEAPEWGVRLRIGAGGDPWTWRCRLDAVRTGLRLRGRRPGDRVSTTGGTRKVQDVLVDAKVPRFARDRVAVLADGDEAVAVVGFTSPPSSAEGIVVDAEPIEGAGWWTRRRPGP